MVSAHTVDDLTFATDYIKNEIAGVVNSFCRIGFKLYEVNKNKLFEFAGLKNISEYGEQYLGFKKSSTANYISICKKFSVKNFDGEPTDVLLSNFESFSYTQLSEMLYLPSDKLDDIKPNMTAKEIRAVKASDDSSLLDSAEESNEVDLYNCVASIFDRKLTEENLVSVIDLLRENIGKTVSITVY
ncbi:MAG: hypothetical protein RR115_02205 [Hydrogenoanaerobacterium sp.]